MYLTCRLGSERKWKEGNKGGSKTGRDGGRLPRFAIRWRGSPPLYYLNASPHVSSLCFCITSSLTHHRIFYCTSQHLQPSTKRSRFFHNHHAFSTAVLWSEVLVARRLLYFVPRTSTSLLPQEIIPLSAVVLLPWKTFHFTAPRSSQPAPAWSNRILSDFGPS